MQLKQAIKTMGKGLGYIPKECDKISKEIDHNEKELRNQHPELFKHVDRVIGVIIGRGLHASGIVAMTGDLEADIGTIWSEEKGNKGIWNVPTTCISMFGIDYLQYSKMDVLGLEGVKVIKNTCDIVGLNYRDLMADRIPDDPNVWLDMAKDTTSIFQFEGGGASDLLRSMLNPNSIRKIKEVNKDFRYIDIMAFASAALRPSGKGYRDIVKDGSFIKHGSPDIDNFLLATQGVLVYQETQIRNSRPM